MTHSGNAFSSHVPASTLRRPGLVKQRNVFPHLHRPLLLVNQTLEHCRRGHTSKSRTFRNTSAIPMTLHVLCTHIVLFIEGLRHGLPFLGLVFLVALSQPPSVVLAFEHLLPKV